MVNGIAVALFIALFTFGSEYFHWGGKEKLIHLALFASYLFGVLSAWKTGDR